jgi:hypothetical protein
MMPFLALAAGLSAAQAAPAAAPACDTKPLVAAYNNAPIAEIGAAFLKIVDCDTRIAAKVAPEKLPKMPYNETATKAAIAAIEVGATDAAIAWVDKLQSDDRASAVRLLGQKCNESSAVQQFFLGRAAAKPNEFWDQRWFRALGECHSQPVQDLLWTEVAKGPGGDRSRYFSVLETYARCAGAAAVPKLESVRTVLVVGGVPQVLADACSANGMTVVDVDAELPKQSAERDFEPARGDDHWIVYTGGTTGFPKGVQWHMSDYYYACLSGGNPYGDKRHSPQEVADNVSPEGGFKIVISAPLMHGAGLFTAAIVLALSLSVSVAGVAVLAK